MTNSELSELILIRLYELAERQGHGKHISLNTLAAELGVEDKGKVLNVARLLESRGQIRAVHTVAGSSAFITGEGAVLVESGGQTGVIDSYRSDPGRWLRSSMAHEEMMEDKKRELRPGEKKSSTIGPIVSSILDADLADRQRLFANQVKDILARLADGGMLRSTTLINLMQDAAVAELRSRSELIIDTWARVVRAYPADASRIEADEVINSAATRFEEECRRIRDTANPPAVANSGYGRVELDNEEYELYKGKLEANLRLTIRGATAELAIETATSPSSLPPEVFVVHGHDQAVRESVARFLEKAGLRPIILHEQANRGQTIIEKLEEFADVGFAVVLLTPDDKGKAVNEDRESFRARQNVIFEMGYFFALLGRHRVCAVHKGVEIPTDLSGLVYIAYDQAGAWKAELARELQAAGYSIDVHRSLGIEAG